MQARPLSTSPNSQHASPLMTDLLHTIPDFPVKLYTHLIPSLEKHLITTTDLLTLDALEVAKRAQLPLLDVRRLANHVLAVLQGQLGLENENAAKFENVGKGQTDFGTLKQTGKEITTQWNTISTLNLTLDAALGGGIPTGYITEITGERYAPLPHPSPLPPHISTKRFLFLLAAQEKPNSSSASSYQPNFPHPTAFRAQPSTYPLYRPSPPCASTNSCARTLFSPPQPTHPSPTRPHELHPHYPTF